VPKDFSAQAEYRKGFGVNELFPVFNSGVKTDRDSLFINRDKRALAANIKTLLSGDMDSDFMSTHNVKDSSGYKLTRVIRGREFAPDHVTDIVYRPFDWRWIYYDKAIISRPAEQAMRHMSGGDNLGLATIRSHSKRAFRYVLVAKTLVDGGVTGAWSYFFPLYVYPDKEEIRLDAEASRKPNLNADIVKVVADKTGLKFVPEKTAARNTFAPVDLLDYIYAVLHSPTYREKFREFLKIDFPRVPYPRDAKHFRALAKLGAELRELHLMQSPKLNRLITTYPEPGDNTVTAVVREKAPLGLTKARKNTVWINKTQRFERVPQVAWDFPIGGYLPAQKYLKDRNGRVLTGNEIRHYQKIIVALVETAKVMQKIDAIE